MNVLLLICLVSALVVLPWNILLRPVADMVDVWFGFEVKGWAAKLTSLVHWGIYAAGTWGFWKLSPWMSPWAAVYVGQVAFSHLLWSELSPNGRGWPIGLIQAIAILFVALALWRARSVFQHTDDERYATFA
jgi:hypothetical protein